MNSIDAALDGALAERGGSDGELPREPIVLAFNIRTFLLGQKGHGARTVESIYYYGPHRIVPLIAILVATMVYYLVLVAAFEGMARWSFTVGAAGNAVCLGLVLLVERWGRVNTTRRLLAKEAVVVSWMMLTLFWLYRGVLAVRRCSEDHYDEQCVSTPAMAVALLLPAMCWHRIVHPRWHVFQACASVVVLFIVAVDTSQSGAELIRSESSFVFVAMLQISCATSSWLGSRAALEGIVAAHQSDRALRALKARVDATLPRMVDVSVCEAVHWRRHWASTYTGEGVLMYCCVSTPMELRHDALEGWLWHEALRSHLGESLQSTLGTAAPASKQNGGSRTVVGCNGDLLFAVLCSRDGEAHHINGKNIKAFLRLVARFQSSLVRLRAAATTKLIVHRGFVSCLCVGEHGVQVQPMGAAVAEAALAVPLCTLGTLCATSCVANTVQDAWTSSTPLGTVTPKINPIAFQVVELVPRAQGPSGTSQPPSGPVTEAPPRDAQLPPLSAATTKKSNREKGVTIVSVAEQEERQTMLSQLNGLDALVALSSRHPSHGCGTTSTCRPHQAHGAAAYRTMRQTAEALCTPRFPHGIDFGAHDGGKWSYLEQPYWWHSERASYRQRLVALFVCAAISAFLTASTTSDADRGYHLIRLLLSAGGAVVDVAVLFLSLHSSPLHRRPVVLFVLHGIAWCCLYAAAWLRDVGESPLLEVVALIRTAAFLNGFCQRRWWWPAAAALLGVYAPVVVRSALKVAAYKTSLCIGFTLTMAPLLPLPLWTLSDARAAFLRSYISGLASDDMTRGLTAERKCLTTVLGKTHADHVLRQGLQLHAPRWYPRAIVLAIALPQICLPIRQDPQRGIHVMHQLRRTLDHIATAYGCELLTPCYGDVLCYANYFGEVYSPQLNVRRIKAAMLRKKQNGGVQHRGMSDLPPARVSPHEAEDNAGGAPLSLSPAVCWNVRLTMEMWAGMSRCVQSALHGEGESSGTPSKDTGYERHGSEGRMPATRSESLVQSEMTASLSTRASSTHHVGRSEAINTSIACVDVGHLRCGISSIGGDRLVLGASGRPLDEALRLVREPSWCMTGGVPVLRMPKRLEVYAIPELEQPLVASAVRVSLQALPHAQCLEVPLLRTPKARPPVSVLKGEFEEVQCEFVEESIVDCTSLAILEADASERIVEEAMPAQPTPDPTPPATDPIDHAHHTVGTIS